MIVEIFITYEGDQLFFYEVDEEEGEKGRIELIICYKARWEGDQSFY